MTTFLFWNLNKRPLETLVAELAGIHQVDVLILAECEIPSSVIQGALNQNPGSMFYLTDSECEKIVIYTRFSSKYLQKQFDDSRLTIRRLRLPGSDEILLAALHIQASYIGTKRARAPNVTAFHQQFVEWKTRSDTAEQSWLVTSI